MDHKTHNLANTTCDSCKTLVKFIYCKTMIWLKILKKQKTKFYTDLDLFSDEIYLEKVKEIDIKKDLQNIEPSNVFQIEAIKNSLNNSFSLIHGPPGWFWQGWLSTT